MDFWKIGSLIPIDQEKDWFQAIKEYENRKMVIWPGCHGEMWWLGSF